MSEDRTDKEKRMMQAKLNAQERRDMIAKLRALPAQLEAVVAPLTREQLMTHFQPKEWNVAQNVHHLADAHMNSFTRLKLILTEEHPTFKSSDTDRWAALPDADNPDVENSLHLLSGLHARMATLFETLNDDQWLKSGVRADGNDISVEDLLRIYSGHGERHIEQINQTLAAR
ncbi:MAG TPA: DinB family protein [Anaerolineae bacterium]